MKRIFVDTSFLVAFHHIRDGFHERARRLMSEQMVEHWPFQLIITDYIFDEFVTVIQKRISKEKASEEGQLLLDRSDVELEWITAGHFTKAWDVFCKFQDKRWSFTDCTSYVWVDENRPDFSLATDPDFDQFGLVPNLMRS